MLVVVATLGRVGGAFGPARLVRLPIGEAVQLGVLLNTRGVTDLVFLAARLQLHILDTGLYSSLVCIALITTAATGPLLTKLGIP